MRALTSMCVVVEKIFSLPVYLFRVALQNENTAVKLELSELRGVYMCVRVCMVSGICVR